MAQTVAQVYNGQNVIKVLCACACSCLPATYWPVFDLARLVACDTKQGERKIRSHQKTKEAESLLSRAEHETNSNKASPLKHPASEPSLMQRRDTL